MLLSLLLTRTRFGRAVRATVQNPTAATLLGVDADRVADAQLRSRRLDGGRRRARSTASSIPFNPGSHYDLISRLLSIVVLGGLGSLGGAVVAALAMGMIEAIVAVEISPTWSAFSFFIVLIAFLLVRPQGIFGVRERHPVSRATAAGLVARRSCSRAARRVPVRRPRRLDREHRRLHAHVRRARDGLEPLSADTRATSRSGRRRSSGSARTRSAITFEHVGIGSGYNPFYVASARRDRRRARVAARRLDRPADART